MQEEADPVFQPHLSEFGGQRNEVVIMNPDDVVRLDHRRQPVCEEAVDAEIAGHFLPAIFGEVRR